MRWSARGSLITGFLAVALLLAGIVGWGMMTTIAGAIVASGQVTIPEHSQVVDHPDGGVVEEILVKNGDLVEEGQPVIRLDRTYLDAELNIASTQLFEAEALASRLVAERDNAESVNFPQALVIAAEERAERRAILSGEEALFVARKQSFNAQIVSLSQQSIDLSNQIEGKKQQLSSYQEQIDLLDKELVSVNQLWEKGLVQESRLLALKRERARMTAVIEELNGAIEASVAQQWLIKLEIDRLTATRMEEIEGQLHEANRKVDELIVQVTAIQERVTRLVMTAPMAGLVHNLSVNTIGSVIRPADPVLYVIPRTGNIGVTARVDPTSIDSIKPDQAAKIKFSAFNSRLTPDLSGHVIGVSADALQDERTGATYYRVELRLDPGQQDLLGDQTLIPGMPAEVFISTTPQSPMNYLLRPFLDYLDRALKQ
jgi:HlyD family secretion protein